MQTVSILKRRGAQPTLYPSESSSPPGEHFLTASQPRGPAGAEKITAECLELKTRCVARIFSALQLEFRH